MLDAFKILGIPYQLLLSDSELKRIYLNLVSACHPDKFGFDSEQQQEAIIQTSKLNEAYRKMQTLEGRVQHYLEIQKVESGLSITTPSLPAAFLIEMMEWNEELEMLDMQNKNAVISVGDMLQLKFTETRLKLNQLCQQMPESGKVLNQDVHWLQDLELTLMEIQYLNRLQTNFIQKQNHQKI